MNLCEIVSINILDINTMLKDKSPIAVQLKLLGISETNKRKRKYKECLKLLLEKPFEIYESNIHLDQHILLIQKLRRQRFSILEIYYYLEKKQFLYMKSRKRNINYLIFLKHLENLDEK